MKDKKNKSILCTQDLEIGHFARVFINYVKICGNKNSLKRKTKVKKTNEKSYSKKLCKLINEKASTSKATQKQCSTLSIIKK